MYIVALITCCEMTKPCMNFDVHIQPVKRSSSPDGKQLAGAGAGRRAKVRASVARSSHSRSAAPPLLRDDAATCTAALPGLILLCILGRRTLGLVTCTGEAGAVFF